MKKKLFIIENYKPYDKSGAYGIQDYSMFLLKILKVVLIMLLDFQYQNFINYVV